VQKISGTLKRSDLEGGVWVFQASDGEQYHLADIDSKWLQDGSKLELEGEVMENMMGIGMMGPTFRVTKARSV
jgi:hypothetical protein